MSAVGTKEHNRFIPSSRWAAEFIICNTKFLVSGHKIPRFVQNSSFYYTIPRFYYKIQHFRTRVVALLLTVCLIYVVQIIIVLVRNSSLFEHLMKDRHVSDGSPPSEARLHAPMRGSGTTFLLSEKSAIAETLRQPPLAHLVAAKS